MSADPATAYAALRDETAEMLKLDAANLSLVEGLQLDLVSLLRLEVDGLQGQVLAGDAVDLARLSTALTMLQKLLPVNSLTAPAPGGGHDFSGAREELEHFLVKRAEAIERRDSRLRDEIAEREELAAVAAAAPIDATKAAPPPPEPLEPAPEQPSNVQYLSARRQPNGLPPSHYLKQREPWEAATAQS